jgi:hypothetical protein
LIEIVDFVFFFFLLSFFFLSSFFLSLSFSFPSNQASGHLVMSIKANCIDSTAPAEVVFASEVDKLKKGGFKPIEQMTLEPFERDHAVVTAIYRPPPKQGSAPAATTPRSEKKDKGEDRASDKKDKKSKKKHKADTAQ